ncbi:MAG TPA: hypothetical protein VH561_05480 [Micromonosporaceae bacterium]|jgi:hypothetical protein
MERAVLEPGDKRTGVFIHAEDERAPCVVGALWVDEERGVLAEIPYIAQAGDQFATPTRWFGLGLDRTPRNLVFRSEDLSVSLFECRTISTVTGSHLDIGRLRVKEAVFAEQLDDIDDPLRVTKLVSHIDGLGGWSNLTSVKQEFEPIGSRHHRAGTRVRYTIESAQGFSWLQGAARMRLVTDWRDGGSDDPGIHLIDDTVVESRFKEPRPVADHLAEHRKFRDLFSLIIGTGAYFRGHTVRDRRLGVMTFDQKVKGAPYQPLLAAGTVAEHYRPRPDRNEENWPMLAIVDLTPQALTWWAQKYNSSQRFVLPTTAALRRTRGYSEDRIINAAMSIEAIGPVLGPVQGEGPTLARKKPTIATHFLRALENVEVDPTPLATSTVDLARALADTYNTVKHADRGDFPDGLVQYYAGRLSLVLSRMAILGRLPGAGGSVKRYAKSDQVERLFEGMKVDGIRVKAGEFSTTP